MDKSLRVCRRQDVGEEAEPTPYNALWADHQEQMNEAHDPNQIRSGPDHNAGSKSTRSLKPAGSARFAF